MNLYRRRSQDVSKHKQSQAGLLEWHELFNIHSHITGVILFITLPFLTYMERTNLALVQTGDIVALSLFFFGVATCFFLSAAYHTFGNHSPRVAALGNQFDYLGIIILMWGATIPSVYYGFHCELRLQMQYWLVISMLALACATATLHPRFRHPTLRKYRAVMYSSLGFSSVIFVIHGLILYGWERQMKRMSLDWMAATASFNVMGAIAYAIRIPERWSPYTFDFFGSSHQILHVMVIISGLAHMMGLLRALDYIKVHETHCI
ncbi:Hly-III related protein [Aaosphaeria arxii CBS 175.79]|uniref:Hly-III related protein n=1 Tax=Aaosphaeria arxii CBS 175.79 TaxID=1450172 RepID=A0A6A5X6B4_9PLEO|nr:Hly-III related protein [Aaosphaeria arxii CBS 175.79]KAF2008555.1 Hly-III related protein [Aaosphaeria arxii CBS 175.79]